jgi:hypothetical protein
MNTLKVIKLGSWELYFENPPKQNLFVREGHRVSKAIFDKENKVHYLIKDKEFDDRKSALSFISYN